MKFLAFSCLAIIACVAIAFVLFAPPQSVADEKDFPKLSEEEVKAASDENQIATKIDETKSDESKAEVAKAETKADKDAKQSETATFANGCFWCTEAVFQRIKGVESVRSGYLGGKIDNPTYKQVCSGKTGHAEALEIVFDPEVVTYDELLEVFWRTHDPTTLNRQGNDRGTQYRSGIFFHSQEQKKLAEIYKAKLDEAKAFNDPIVTEITEASKFYPAEDYHQNYFNLNKSQPYCRAIIVPKVEKLEKVFADKLKQK